MLKVGFRRPPDFNRLGAKEMRQLREQILRDLTAGLREMQQSIMLTPVYTGRTLINYQWSLDGPQNQPRTPVKTPALPGTTSTMALGQEPRRAAQASVVQAEFTAMLAGLKGNPLRHIYLVNNTPYFDQVEYGTYKTSEGHTQRTPPGGMVRRGETMLEQLVPGLRKRGGGV